MVVRDSVAAGAHLKAGGTYEGLFYRPTVLDSVTPGMRAFDEEIFGPVASVTTFCNDDEAIALAKSNAKAKFDETIEIALNLGIDPLLYAEL